MQFLPKISSLVSSSATISSALFIVMMTVAMGMSLKAGYKILPELPKGEMDDWVKGRAAHAFDTKFATLAPGYEPSRTLWGTTDYLLFREGRDGVIVGLDGWLYSSEEFSWPKKADATVDANLKYVEQVNQLLSQKNIQMIVAVVPAKVRVEAEHLDGVTPPQQRQGLYDKIVHTLAERQVMTIDALNKLRQDKNSFLKTDTHWSPAGAQIMAHELAGAMKVMAAQYNIPIRTTEFVNKAVQDEVHSGDLLRYIPMGDFADLGPKPDMLKLYTTESPTSGDTGASDSGLFGDASIPYTLVGTSYSANPKWNFAGFLKESIGADILNAADPGLGPFATMKAYLESAAFKDTPPRFIIWEMPERYFAISEPVTMTQE